MSEQWRARDSVLCGSLCFLFLVLLHQVRARPEQLVAHTRLPQRAHRPAA